MVYRLHSLLTVLCYSYKSLVIYRVASKNKVTPDVEGAISRVTEALHYIHGKGFLHNDLKANNVVLEKREDGYNAGIIDFGKSSKIDEPKKRKKLSRAPESL